MTGVGLEPTTYGLKVRPGLKTAHFSKLYSGQLVHHSGALVRAQTYTVPLSDPLPLNGQNASVLTPFPWRSGGIRPDITTQRDDDSTGFPGRVLTQG